jgi:hypothetical protein
MALSAYAFWEVRSLGSDNNSGGFDPNATMKSTLSCSDGTSSTPTVTASDYTFVSQDVGYYLYIKSGTNWTPGWYLITSVSAGNATVNATGGQFIKANSIMSSSNGIGSTDNLSSGTWAIDYSQNNSARISFTDLYLNSTTTCSSVLNPITSAMIGNTIRIISGTGFTASIYVIKSTSGTIATLDRAAGTSLSSGGVANLGGAFATIYTGLTSAIYVGSYNIVYIKADGVYEVSGTTISYGGGSAPHFVGYGTYRTDKVRPQVSLISPNTSLLRRWDGTYTRMSNIEIDGNNNRLTYGFAFTNNQANSTLTNCVFKNMTGNYGSGIQSRFCVHDNCGGAGSINDYCIFTNKLDYNIIFSNIHLFSNSIVYRNFISNDFSWQNSDQISYGMIKNNIIHQLYSSSAGHFLATYNNCAGTLPSQNEATTFVLNNIVSDIRGATVRVICGAAPQPFLFDTNAYFANAGGVGTTYYNSYSGDKFLGVNDIILTKSPFRNALAGDFTLNDDIGGGKEVRYDATPLTLQDTNTKQNKDIGPFQSKNPPLRVNMSGGMRG